MIKSKLFEQMAALNSADFKKFGEFVYSPFHNKNKKLQDLFACIENYHPELNHPELNKKALFQSMYGRAKYNDSKLRAMMSLLSKLLDEFLVANQLKQSTALSNRLLLDAYLELGLEKYYSTKLTEAYQRNELEPFRDTQYFFDRYSLEERSYNFAVRSRDQAIGESLSKLADDLDIHYLANRLKYSCEMLNRQNITGEEYDLHLLEVLQSVIKDNPLKQVPVINIYYQITRTFQEPENEAHFNMLLTLLKEHSAIFPASESKVMYGYAMNYCIKKINTGRSDYLQKIFLLYKLLLEHDIIYEGQYISEWDYKNIVTVGLRLEEPDWTEAFINDYKGKLPPAVRENAFRYNLANLKYFRGNYAETLSLLREVEFTEMSYQLSAKSLLLKSYYELGEYLALFPHADAFKLFLRRSRKISGYQKTIYKNLIRYIVKLSKLKSHSRTIPGKLVDDINASTEIADKTWLLNKVK